MRLRAWIWLACAVVLLTWTALRFVTAPPLETDLLALLPATERNPLAEQAATRLGRLTGERAIFLVGLPNPDAARSAATAFAAALEGGPFRTIVTRIPNPDPGALLTLYAPHRFGLIAPDLRGLADPVAALAARLEARLASPFGGGVLSLEDDPFALFDAWLQSLPLRQFRLELEDGWLTTRDGTVHWILVSAELAGSAFDPALQDTLAARLQDAETRLGTDWPGVQILRAGAVFHAITARISAEREAQMIGIGSLIGIISLLLLVYRSPGPLALGLLSVAVGVCAGALATVATFGRLHLMTLVFGASLIGEAVDYSIQYFSVRLGAGSAWNAREGLRSVLPALAIALATSVVGYAALALTAFPAMQQIAVFAICGLAAAWLTVVLILPWWLGQPQTRVPHRLLVLPARWLKLWRIHATRRGLGIATSVLLLAAAPGWLRLSANDDVRQLIQSEPALVAQETRLRSLTGFEPGSQFFLIEGSSAEDVLQREETLAERLRERGVSLRGVASFVPSCARQQQNHQGLQSLAPALARQLDDFGFRSEASAAWTAQLDRAPSCLTMAQWLDSPISTPFRHLWIGATPRGVATLALPAGYTAVAPLEDATRTLDGVTLVDKPGAVSRLFGEYRQLAAIAIAAAAALIFGVLAWRYGPAGAAAILAPPVVAQGLALGVLGHAGVVINLFNVLALLLVLGVGINYSIFMYESAQGENHREAAALIGVALSAATTLLSFGLLALSSMPALAGFGITLTLGIGIAVATAPAALIVSGR